MEDMKVIECCLVGTTGLVGSQLLSCLKQSSAIKGIHAYTRRQPSSSADPKITLIQDSDSTSWPRHYPSNTSIFFSALGTTARQAGSFAAQRTIDYDLNLALAKVAKEQGVSTYVLISTSGASVTSRIPYSRMKGELDEAVKAIGFQRTIILKPGLLVGTREDSRPGEFAARKVAGWLGSWSEGWAQSAEVVARAAVKAALEEGEGVTVLSQKDIVRLGNADPGVA